MSAIAYGYPQRRPRGRHITLAEYAPELVDGLGDGSQPVDAEAVVGALRDELSKPGGRSETLRDVARLVVCGIHGRKVAVRCGRCPKCGGYAMTLHEIARHRERVQAAREGENGAE